VWGNDWGGAQRATSGDLLGDDLRVPATCGGGARAGDPHAFRVEVAAAEGNALELTGIPTATVRVRGTGHAMHLFLKLVDREAGTVVNLQETPCG
jgi:hypothetical protein